MEAAASVTNTAIGRCATPGCNAPAERCIEDLSPAECPHFVVGPEPDEVATDNSRRSEPEVVVTVSRGGAALSVAEADMCIMSTPTGRRIGLISLVGVPDCGKTTLFSSLYEIVRRDSVAELSFAGSETIRGFEERCHLSRLASLRESPDTPRTAAELRFLHMSIVTQQSGERIELFMTDRRGEQFQELLDRPSLSETFFEVRRGDNVAFLLDGEHLIDGGQRELAIAKVIRLAMALSGVLQQPTAVQLVVTKNDKIRGHVDEMLIRSRIEALSSNLVSRFGPVSRYTLHCVAARDLDDDSNGLSQLLSEWLRRPESRATEPVAVPRGNNAFERLMNLRRA